MKLLIILFLAIMTPELFAQDHHLENRTHSHHQGFHFSLAIAHTYIPESTVSGKKTITVPTIGFDIDYFFLPKFGIGFHNDLELMIFEVKEAEGMSIERAYPLVLTMDMLYRPTEKTILFAGPGIELESDQNFGLFRVGIEYIAHLNDCYSFSPIFSYDFRFNAYNSFSVGIGIGLEL